MAQLTGNQIDQSYLGLIKTVDNAALDPTTAKQLTDGGGNNLPISASQAGVVYTGTQDFTGATVTGAGGAAGLVVGTGTDSIKSAASLTTTPATATGTNSIAIGEGADATNSGTTAVGKGTAASGFFSTAYGQGATASGVGSMGLGNGSKATGSNSVAIGNSAGYITGVNTESIGIGSEAGYNGGTESVSIGKNASGTATGAVALGADVTGAIANTVSVKALETQTDGGISIKGDGTNAGKLKLYCEDAGGAHNITLEGPAHTGGATYTLKFPNVQSAGTQILQADNAGNLEWINTPSGGGGSAGLVVGTGADSLQNAVGTASTASGAQSIALGKNATASGAQSMAYGNDAQATQVSAASFGEYAEATSSYAIAFGRTAAASGDGSVAFGQQTSASAAGAVAMGRQVTAAVADTVTVNMLQMQNWANLQYTSDSAAAAGGIPLGGLYQNTGDVRIRIV